MSELSVKEKLAIKKRLEKALYKKASVDFRTYVQLMAPLILSEGFTSGKHIDLLCEVAQEVVDGEDGRIQVWISPRSMKSLLMNVLLGSWVRGRHPAWDIMCVSNSDSNAKAFSKQVQEIVKLEEYQNIFPDVNIKDDESAVTMWRVQFKKGGKIVNGGLYKPAGVGTAIAGRGAHLAIVDDPLSEQDANSEVKRKAVKDWYPQGLRSRLAPGGRIIVINTRWHLDDLSGYLLDEADKNEMADQWAIVSVPAILDAKAAELLELPEGGSYWPERWSYDRLMATKANMPPGQWAALYMQDPTLEGGVILDPALFKAYYGKSPPKCDYLIMSLDTAFSEKQEADFSVIQTWGIFTTPYEDNLGRESWLSNMILLGNTRGHFSFPELEERLLKLYDLKKPDLIIIEKKASGQSLIQVLRRRGLPILEYTPDKDKITRAHSVVPLLHAGRIWLPEGKGWAHDLVDECSRFPYGKNDDQVDAMVQAGIYLRDSWKVEHYIQKEEPQHYKKKAKTPWQALTNA